MTRSRTGKRFSRRLRWRWLVALLLVLALPAALFALASWPQSQVYGPIVTSGPDDRPRIALTFDDGPNGIYTAQILDILRDKGVRATFFIVGANAEAQPELVRRAAAEGHALGNHSYHHRKSDALRDPRYRDAARAQAVIEAVAGVRPTIFRAPSGFHTPWQLMAVRGLGLATVHWDVQTTDWERPDPETIVRRVLDRAGPGAIVLMHDGEESRPGADRSPTVAALPILIDALRSRGYELVTVPELLGIPATQPARLTETR